MLRASFFVSFRDVAHLRVLNCETWNNFWDCVCFSPWERLPRDSLSQTTDSCAKWTGLTWNCQNISFWDETKRILKTEKYYNLPLLSPTAKAYKRDNFVAQLMSTSFGVSYPNLTLATAEQILGGCPKGGWELFLYLNEFWLWGVGTTGVLSTC